MEQLTALLSQVSPNVNQPLVTLGTWAIGVVVLLGGSTLMLGLIFNGIQKKYGDDYIRKIIDQWYVSPEVAAKREAFTREVIDDQVHRDDGLVHAAIAKAVTTASSGLDEKLDKLIEVSERTNTLYYGVQQNMAEMRGSMEVIRNVLKISHQSLKLPMPSKGSGGSST